MHYRKLTAIGSLLMVALAPARSFAQAEEDAEEETEGAKDEAEADADADDEASEEPSDEAGEETSDATAQTRVKSEVEPRAKAETSPGEAIPPREVPPAPARNGSAPVDPDLGCRNALIENNGWRLGFCGFAALNVMHDSTQSFGMGMHNNLLARKGTYLGDHDQLQFTARDTRLTIDFAAPAQGGIQASGMMQLDFNGLLAPDATEQQQYVFGVPRVRHALLRVRTPVVDVLAGQFHDLFAWGGAGFYPATAAFLGVPGQIFHRQPQLRLSKKLRTTAVEFEVAAAATRPVHKASGVPDGQAGLRLGVPAWTGVSTQGYGQPGLTPLGVAVSGVARRFEVAEFLERPAEPLSTTGYGIVANAVLPIVPIRSNEDRKNGLTLTAEFSTGTGISDLYTDLTGGARFPTLNNDAGRAIPPMYPPNIDSGIVTFDANGDLHTIDWQGFVIGAQYYLPVFAGRIWIAGIYSQIKSNNIVELTPIPSRGFVFERAEYMDGSVFVAITEALQTEASFQTVEQTFGDGVKARNNRFAFGAHLFF